MNRGGTIIVQLLRPAQEGASVVNPDDGAEEMSLPVGFHSPLHILKEMLHDITGIPLAQQVLILRDLTDKERNKDKVLGAGLDTLTLRECGVKTGDTLTLHGLGLSGALKTKLLKEAEAAQLLAQQVAAKAAANGNIIHSLVSRVDAAHSNHSFSGIIFDVEVKGPHEINVTSIAIGGMLGRVRIYGRTVPWQEGTNRNHDMPSIQGWRLLTDTVCRPSWDRHCQIPLQKKFTLLPHTKHGIYIHSALPGDLGIQYQSYPLSAVVAENEYLRMTPGLGHASRDACEPFDDTVSWYRQYRCMAGSLSFEARRLGWSPPRHKIFPAELKHAVMAMLLCQLPEKATTNAALSIITDKHIIYSIFEFTHWDWFSKDDDTEEDEDEEDIPNARQLTLLERLQQMMYGHGNQHNTIEEVNITPPLP